MTNILQLPQISATFRVANNADWRDALSFRQADNTALNIAGITFRGQLRASAESMVVLMQIGTANGMLVNDGAAGTLTWAVPASALSDLGDGTYAFDLIAEADGKVINLFQKAGPATVIVHQGVTR